MPKVFCRNISPLKVGYNIATVSSQVAVLDIDICGPSIPRLMGCEGEQVHQSGSGWSPVVSGETSPSTVVM